MRRLMRERHYSYCGKELFGGAIKRPYLEVKEQNESPDFKQ